MSEETPEPGHAQGPPHPGQSGHGVALGRETHDLGATLRAQQNADGWDLVRYGNEILFSLKGPEDFILAIVEFLDDAGYRLELLGATSRPDQNEISWSVNTLRTPRGLAENHRTSNVRGDSEHGPKKRPAGTTLSDRLPLARTHRPEPHAARRPGLAENHRCDGPRAATSTHAFPNTETYQEMTGGAGNRTRVPKQGQDSVYRFIPSFVLVARPRRTGS